MPTTISPIPSFKDNYIWVISYAKKNALVIDPGDHAPVITFLEQRNLRLTGILLTHHHWDHSQGVAELLQYAPVPVYGSHYSPLSIVTHRLKDGDKIDPSPGSSSYEVFEIPGHTLDHIAFYGEGNLFCGDTLFTAGCGRLFEGTPDQLYHSLQKISALPAETRIYCGHEYTLKNLQFAHLVEPNNLSILQRIEKVQRLRTQGLPSVPALLSEEKSTNPFLRCHIQTVQEQIENHLHLKLSNPVDVFAALREWKNHF